jgi:hypothetical protein
MRCELGVLVIVGCVLVGEGLKAFSLWPLAEYRMRGYIEMITLNLNPANAGLYLKRGPNIQ